MKRWRIIDDEQSTRRYRTLQPFFAADAMKYFMDIKEQEYGYTYTYDTRNYYQQIPTGEITKNRTVNKIQVINYKKRNIQL